MSKTRTMIAPNSGRTPLELIREVQMRTEIRKDMEPEDMLAIAEAMESNRVARGLTKADMSRIIGVHPTAYNAICRLDYKGNLERPLHNARVWLTDLLAADQMPAVEYTETTITRSIIAVCRRAVSRPTIGKIVAPSGTGKTMALREFARQRGDRSLYLYAGECISSRVSLVRELAGRLCSNAVNSLSCERAYRHLREALKQYYANGNGSPFCILVDEATTLNAAAKNTLRNLHDDPECCCAIVLADTARLELDLAGRSTRAQYEQLNSRSRAVWTMSVSDEISAADVDAVSVSVLTGLGHRKRLPAASRKFLHRLAQEPGALRNVANRLRDVFDLADAAGAEATYSVAELDYAATLSGHQWQMAHEDLPFKIAGKADGKGRKLRVAAS